MGISSAFVIGIILLNFFAFNGNGSQDAGGIRLIGSTSDSIQVKARVVEIAAFGSEKLEVVELLAKRKLKLRSDFLYEKLRRIQVDAKEGKMLSEADHSFLAMNKSYKLFQSAVELQKALDALVAHGRRVAALVTSGITVFEKDIEALRAVAKGKAGQEVAAALIEEAEKFGNAAQEFSDLMAKIHSDKDMAKQLEISRFQYKRSELYFKVIVGQMDLDRNVRTMARLVTSKSNIFMQLQKASKVLEQAAHLRKAIKVWKEKKRLGKIDEKSEINQWTQRTVREYNDFARKLEQLGNGVHRNLYGQFRLADIDRKTEERLSRLGDGRKSRLDDGRNAGVGAGDLMVLDNDFWKFIRQLLHDYNTLNLPQMDVIKIRRMLQFDHFYLSIGQIEYDFLIGAVTRRKFRADLDEYTSDSSMEKAAPLAHTGLVSLAKADRVFFEMVQHGWDGQGYSAENGHVCRTFVWNFLCQLFDGKCPTEAQMPLYFLDVDKQSPHGSVFKHPEFVMLNENYQQRDDPHNCVLEQREVLLHLVGDKMDLELPPILEYYTDKYREDDKRLERLIIQAQAEEDYSADVDAFAEHDGLRHFKANLTAFVCKKNGQELAYIANVKIFDQRRQKMLIEGGEDDFFGGTRLMLVELVKNKHFNIEADSSKKGTT